MSRPLTPFSEEQVKEYEGLLESASLNNDKQRVKEIKRLFLEYIRKRGYTINAFKDKSIYQYFKDTERVKRIEQLKQEIEKLKSESLLYLGKIMYFDFERKIKFKENEIERLVNKKFYMRGKREEERYKQIKGGINKRKTSEEYKIECEILSLNNEIRSLEEETILIEKWHNDAIKRIKKEYEKNSKKEENNYKNQIKHLEKRRKQIIDKLEMLEKNRKIGIEITKNY